MTEVIGEEGELNRNCEVLFLEAGDKTEPDVTTLISVWIWTLFWFWF